MAAVPAAAASTGRPEPASSGPSAPLPTSTGPTTMSGQKPATLNKAEPDTVPDPTSRRSVPANRVEAMFANGTPPAAKEAVSTAAPGSRIRFIVTYPARQALPDYPASEPRDAVAATSDR